MLALLVAGALVPEVCLAQGVFWRICEVYSNADGSSQFIQFCGGSDEQVDAVQTTENTIVGRSLVVRDGAEVHSFVFPYELHVPYYDSHRFLVGTQGFANLNLIKPDFVVPNGFLLAPNGSISLSNHDTVTYAGLPTDGVHAIDTGIASRPSNGDPSTTVTLATASDYDWYSYGFGSPRGANVAGGRWVPTGSLHEARWRHTATLLQNGKVLIVGGFGVDPDPKNVVDTVLNTAELYDPATGTWSATGRLNAPKSEHSATLLPSGMVLVVGFSDNPAANAELYDPITGAWKSIAGPSGNWRDHTATLLGNGKVMLAAGWGSPYDSYYRAVVYDPDTGTWSNTGSLSVPRGAGQQATLLQDGRVLVSGGTNDPDFSFPLHSVESYDPNSGRWSRIAPLRTRHTGDPTIRLTDGSVLVAGRISERFNPATGRWSVAEPVAVAGDSGNSATLLRDGRVLIAGGYRYSQDGNVQNVGGAAELYDPISGTWSTTGSLNTSRNSHTATLLPSGKVLVVGGTGFDAPFAPLKTAELFEPGPIQVAIGAGFTGSWFNPQQNGHGFALEVLPGQPMQILASWFTFAPQGGQAWIVGLGPITGERAVLQGFETAGPGGRFPPHFDATAVHQENWGTLTFTFSDCDHGHVEWTSSAPGYGNGGMDLTRLTLPAGLTCSP